MHGQSYYIKIMFFYRSVKTVSVFKYQKLFKISELVKLNFYVYNMFPKSKAHDFICYFLEKSFTLLGFDLKFPKGYFDMFTPIENII